MTPKVNTNLSLDILLVPVLQTPTQPRWPQTNLWHTCLITLPPANYYAVVSQPNLASTLPKKYCQVQLQFVAFKGLHQEEFNLTDPFCLHGTTDHMVKGKQKRTALIVSLQRKSHKLFSCLNTCHGK